jgi:hypothetical protein
VGLNLTTLSSVVKTDLAQSVRAYYIQVYQQTLSNDDDAVIAMLVSQARPEGSRHHAPQALTQADSQRLFSETLPIYEAQARGDLGNDTYDGLSAAERVAVVDLAYNAGTVFPGVADALESGDFVLAGFNLVDARRITQRGNLRDRTEAEYQNLLLRHLSELGQFVQYALVENANVLSRQVGDPTMSFGHSAVSALSSGGTASFVEVGGP